MYNEKEICERIKNLFEERKKECGITENQICRDYTTIKKENGKMIYENGKPKRETKLRTSGNYIDISRTTFRKILKGTIPAITIDQLLSICNYFNISLSYLLGETDYKNNAADNAGKYTGLSPKALENLIKEPELIKHLNYFCECQITDLNTMLFKLHTACTLVALKEEIDETIKNEQKNTEKLKNLLKAGKITDEEYINSAILPTNDDFEKSKDAKYNITEIRLDMIGLVNQIINNTDKEYLKNENKKDSQTETP